MQVEECRCHLEGRRTYHFRPIKYPNCRIGRPKPLLQDARSGASVSGQFVMRDLALNCINVLLLSILLTLAMERFAGRIGLVDIPAGRKNHHGEIPLAGSALFVAFAFAALLLEQPPYGLLSFLLGLALLVMLGLADDLLDLRASVKLIAQIGCTALMVLPADVLVRNVGAILGDEPVMLLSWAGPLTIVGVVGLINAVNMLDGIDGLAGSVSLVAFLWFAAAAAILGLRPELYFALLLGCCLIGFLGFNLRHYWRRRASVFLGDAGSMMLGACLAYLAIRVSQQNQNHGEALSPVAVLWILALPVIDTISLTFRRIAAGHSPFTGDRQHVHHILLQAGYSVSETVSILAGTAIVLGGIGMVGWHLGVPDWVLLLGLVCPVGLHVWFVRSGWKHVHRQSRHITAAGSAMEPPLLESSRHRP
jgi:UDP-GlcNAc:undecaprenyl-phosphate/decaprenyl-phosphate GlcNAc-1-phosphate transferase